MLPKVSGRDFLGFTLFAVNVMMLPFCAYISWKKQLTKSLLTALFSVFSSGFDALFSPTIKDRFTTSPLQ